MEPEDVGGTSRWKNCLVVFNGEEGPEVGFIVHTDGIYVHIEGSYGELIMIRWRYAEMLPFARFDNHAAPHLDIDSVMAEHPRWAGEASLLKSMLTARWQNLQAA